MRRRGEKGLTRLIQRILRTHSRPLQIGLQLFARRLSRRMDREFSRAEINWNGHPSCLLLSFDVDFPEDALALPGIVETMRDFSIKSSFACVGRWVEDYPDPHRVVLDGGHELFNHSYSHPELINSPQHFVSSRDDFNPRSWHALELEEKEAEIHRCQETVRAILNYRMEGFRVPHFGNVESGDLYPILEKTGLRYSTSQLAPRSDRFGLPIWKGSVLEIPVTTCPRHPFASFDSWHAFYARDGWHGEDFLELVKERLSGAVRFHGLTNIYLDPKDLNRFDFRGLLDFIGNLGASCWTPTYSDFTGWYRTVIPPRV